MGQDLVIIAGEVNGKKLLTDLYIDKVQASCLNLPLDETPSRELIAGKVIIGGGKKENGRIKEKRMN
ncbi:MAG: hypothetical protein NTV58_00935 [Deltaproteobacteria bacterium]|nr:hypothetical protein [Deltaproteobacteria bacterium]